MRYRNLEISVKTKESERSLGYKLINNVCFGSVAGDIEMARTKARESLKNLGTTISLPKMAGRIEE